MIKKKTYDEHLEYLYDIVKLKCWFLWNWLKKHPEESFTLCIRERVDIYRKTDINKDGMNPVNVYFDSPEWLALEKEAEQLYKNYKNDSNEKRFEKQCFMLFKETITSRSKRDYEERPYVLDYKCGSLNYNQLPKLESEDGIYIHIANALQPQSIFENKKYLPECFITLMDKVEKEYCISKLTTSTWLNSYPEWLALFPPEWKQNMGKENRDIRWHFGFWGQFINARGVFNRKLGERFRMTGIFPYLPRSSWCTFKSMRKHLTTKFLS